MYSLEKKRNEGLGLLCIKCLKSNNTCQPTAFRKREDTWKFPGVCCFPTRGRIQLRFHSGNDSFYQMPIQYLYPYGVTNICVCWGQSYFLGHGNFNAKTRQFWENQFWLLHGYDKEPRYKDRSQVPRLDRDRQWPTDPATQKGRLFLG